MKWSRYDDWNDWGNNANHYETGAPMHIVLYYIVLWAVGSCPIIEIQFDVHVSLN